MACLIVDRVSKRFENSILAVNNASFSAEEQEFVVLVGPSGCGKTTMLRMIAGLDSITEGTIFIDGKRVNDISPKDRDIAMVFQNYALYPHMSVFDNIAFSLRLKKMSKIEIKEKVYNTAKLLHIEELLARLPRQISGGQRQRVALGRAIVRSPKVFLFDEPLSNLDAIMRIQMRREISKLHNTLKSTMIYVTHDQVEAMTMGSKIIVMKEGIIQQIGDPLSIYNEPTNMFVASFIGSPAMNFINGILLKEQKRLYFINSQIKLPLPCSFSNFPSKKIILGIRPEDIYDSRFKTQIESYIEIDTICEIVEPLGNEYMVYLKSNNENLAARFNQRSYPLVNQHIRITIDISKFHFFDETGKRK